MRIDANTANEIPTFAVFAFVRGICMLSPFYGTI